MEIQYRVVRGCFFDRRGSWRLYFAGALHPIPIQASGLRSQVSDFKVPLTHTHVITLPPKKVPHANVDPPFLIPYDIPLSVALVPSLSCLSRTFWFPSFQESSTTLLSPGER